MRSAIKILAAIIGIAAIPAIAESLKSDKLTAPSEVRSNKDQSRIPQPTDMNSRRKNIAAALIELAQAQDVQAGPISPLPSPRVACEEDINRRMQLVGYLKSKLRLQGAQKDAWQKLEQAGEPALQKIRELCGQLPIQTASPPNLPDMVDMAEKQAAVIAVQLEFLRAIREPRRALYETLSADQRALLAEHEEPPQLELELELF
jgi:hypothetical protein